MRNFVLFLLFFCYVSKSNANNPGYLGISIHNYTNNQIVGVQVVNVFDDGAAKQYGLKENDIITAVNGKKMLKTDDLVNELDLYNWSDLVIIDFLRNGQATSAKVYLGYNGTKRTYNITKSIKNDGEHWLFKDDKTEIVLRSDNSPISISKIDTTGKLDIWIVGTTYKSEEVPQYFLDLDDKVAGIKRVKEDQAKRNCKIKEIVFIKEAKLPQKEQKQLAQNELNASDFVVFPNPTKGQFSVHFSTSEKGKIQLQIFDIVGRIVQTENIENFSGEITKQFNLSNEPKGEYLIVLKIGDKQTNKRIFLH